jgi:hypothetical protein
MKSALLAFSLLPWLVSNQAAAQPSPEPEPMRVLFIGNSYTSVNDLPKMIAELARAGRQRPLAYDTEVPGGRSLEQHYKGGSALKKIASRRWDRVVLQEQSLRPIGDPKAMIAYGEKLDEAVKRRGSKSLLYLTWARQNAPESQSELTRSYRDLAAKTSSPIAPVGLAWEAALKDDPGCRLHAEDGSHPTPKGTYLAACVFYGVLYDESPEGLPGTIAGIDEAEAAKLQKIAWKVVRDNRETEAKLPAAPGPR